MLTSIYHSGTYAIYAIPFETAWTIIIHKNTTHWGDGRTNYNPQEDALRFSVQSIYHERLYRDLYN
ncbi:MAG: DUF2911 domain-containing protein [Cytophagales bacterium]|nr:DUF2911 domain-containing protein [Cytophagales bacterium]